MPFLYKLVPIDVTELDTAAVREMTISTVERVAVGDVVPASPGIWTVERIGNAGTTQWASEAVDRMDPRTVASPVTLYCRVDA